MLQTTVAAVYDRRYFVDSEKNRRSQSAATVRAAHARFNTHLHPSRFRMPIIIGYGWKSVSPHCKGACGSAPIRDIRRDGGVCGRTGMRTHRRAVSGHPGDGLASSEGI